MTIAHDGAAERNRPEANVGAPTVVSVSPVALDAFNEQYRLGLIYHGSPGGPLNAISPRPTFWKRDGRAYPDSDGGVVCATGNLLIASFMALVPREGYPFGYFSNTMGAMDFYVHPELKGAFKHSVGYIAILGGDGFHPFEGGAPEGWPDMSVMRIGEMRATEPKQPLFNVRVEYADFMGMLEERPECGLRYAPS